MLFVVSHKAMDDGVAIFNMGKTLVGRIERLLCALPLENTI